MSCNKKFALINDVLESAKRLAFELEYRGFKTLVITYPRQAFEIYEKIIPDVVISDINNTIEPGFDLIHAHSDTWMHIPLILLGKPTELQPSPFISFEKPYYPAELAGFVAQNTDIVGDLQAIRITAQKSGIKENTLGKVIAFYSDRGWGLLRVVGMDCPLYVNASDIYPQKPFSQLYFGQIVRFDLNAQAPRGPRAEKVEVILEKRRDIPHSYYIP